MRLVEFVGQYSTKKKKPKQKAKRINGLTPSQINQKLKRLEQKKEKQRRLNMSIRQIFKELHKKKVELESKVAKLTPREKEVWEQIFGARSKGVEINEDAPELRIAQKLRLVHNFPIKFSTTRKPGDKGRENISTGRERTKNPYQSFTGYQPKLWVAQVVWSWEDDIWYNKMLSRYGEELF